MTEPVGQSMDSIASDCRVPLGFSRKIHVTSFEDTPLHGLPLSSLQVLFVPMPDSAA
ncbi:MAG: hypothetical protein ABR955_07755 [Verrucomicrobiota bacterium]